MHRPPAPQAEGSPRRRAKYALYSRCAIRCMYVSPFFGSNFFFEPHQSRILPAGRLFRLQKIATCCFASPSFAPRTEIRHCSLANSLFYFIIYEAKCLNSCPVREKMPLVGLLTSRLCLPGPSFYAIALVFDCPVLIIVIPFGKMPSFHA